MPQPPLRGTASLYRDSAVMAVVRPFFVAVALTHMVAPVVMDSIFGYNPDDELGPEHWADEFAECAGKYQSPVDIEESLVTRVNLPPLEFHGIHELPYMATVTNNGHTVLLEINGSYPITLRGGPLRSDYTFQQLHFHWGSNDSFGSEDLINNHSYSMELHMVFFKSEYSTIENSLNFKDGLTVLALFFEVHPENNRVYRELVNSLAKVVHPQTSTELPYQLPLEFLLPKDRQHYFTYNGSLTTPPCLEIVTWIEFKHPVHLSHDQLEMFRRLRSFDGLLTHNTRPVQPLYDRPVWYNTGDASKDSSAPSLPSLKFLELLFVAVMIANVINF